MLFAFLTAFAVIMLRLVLLTLGHPPHATGFMLVHLLAISTVIFISGYRTLQADRSASVPMLLRTNFRSAAVYALCMAIFLWCYFKWAEPHHFQQRIDALVWKGVAEGQPELVIRPRMEAFFTPFNYSTITLAGLLIAGAMLTLLAAVFQHKVLRRLKP